MSPDATDRHDLVEDLVSQCLQGIEAQGPGAVTAILTGQPDDLQAEVRQMLAILTRVGLAGAAQAADAPEQLGGYRLLERIGAGAMGVVYRARREAGDGEVALKLLQPGLLPVRGTRVRFQREIAALRELDHPGICPILDAGEVEGVPFLAMSFVPGESLRARFARGPAGGREDERASLLQVIEKLALALHHAHEHGFVHRDVKPANVLVRPDGDPVLLDFGLARLEQASGSAALTVSGGIVGTPAYMAPEQVTGGSVDRRCDVYACGAVLYEGLTGRCPHEAPTRESLYRRILAGEIARPSLLVHGLPRDLDVVCLTALERDPGRRYQTAKGLALDLERVVTGKPPAARLPGPLLRARRWVARNPLPSGLLLVLLVALGAILFVVAELRASSRVDRARALAAKAMEMCPDDADVALHLALEAHELHPPVAWPAIQAALVAERAEFTLTGSTSFVRTIEFSGEGSRLVAVAEDGTARLWELAAERQRQPLELVGARAFIATFQPHDDLVVTAGADDGRVSAWDARTADQLWVREAHSRGGPVRTLVWSPDGRLLLSGGDRTACVWTAQGERRAELPGDEGTAICAGAWFDAQSFVTGSGPTGDPAQAASRPRLRVWRLPDDAAAPVRLHELDVQGTGIESIQLNPDPARRHLALVVTGERFAQLFDLAQGKLVRRLDATSSFFTTPVLGVGWSPDGKRAFMVAEGGRIETWDAESENLQAIPGGRIAVVDRPGWALANPVLPSFALCGSDTGNVALVNYERRRLRILGGRRLRGAPLAFSRDGNLLAAISWDRTIHVWRMWDQELPAFYDGDRVLTTVWSAGGRQIVTGSSRQNETPPSGHMRIWDVTTGQQLFLSESNLRVASLFPDRTGERMLVSIGSIQGGVHLMRSQGGLWRRDGDALSIAEIEDYVWDAQFIGDDQVLLCDVAGRVLLLDLASRSVLQRIPQHLPSGDAASIYRQWRAMCALPDGSIVWTSGTPGYLHKFVRQEDGSYGEEQPPLLLGKAVRVLKLLPDGSLLVGGFHGFLHRFPPDGGKPIPFHGHLDDVLDIDWTHLDGELLIASSGFAGTIRFWRADGTPLREIVTTLGRIQNLRFSPDGTRLLTAADNGTPRIWPVRNADVLALARRRVRPLTHEQEELLREYRDR